MEFTLGAIPSPYDSRDYTLARSNRILLEERPKIYIPTIQMTQKNQGNVGKCVAAAKSIIRENKEFKQSGKIVVFSEDFLYANREADHYKGEGMYPREACDSLLKKGIVPLDYFNYPNKEYSLLAPLLAPLLEALLPLAEPRKISAYYKTTTQAERELSLLNLGSQTFTFPVYSSFFKTGRDGIIPEPSGELNGYHEMAVYGWDEDFWYGQNSWGSYWGNKGRWKYRKSFPIQESFAEEDKIYPESDGDNVTQEQFNAYMNNYLEMVAAKSPDEWSKVERMWAEQLGIIQGDLNGRKRYKSFITREELITVLYRLIKK